MRRSRAGRVLEAADFSILRDVEPQQRITVLVGPGAGKGEVALSSAAETLSGTTLVKIDANDDVQSALLLALRTGPAVLGVAGQSHFVSEILGGLLALKQADINVPPVLLLSPKKDAAAPLTLATAGKPMAVLSAVTELMREDKLAEHLLNIPLLRVQLSQNSTRLGLIFGVGAYASGFKENFQGLFDTLSLAALHSFAGKKAASNENLCRISPETGGTLTTYLFGALISALPLPVLSTKRTRPDKPLVYLAIEQNRKARMSALRAFRGKLDRAEAYYGVHLAPAAALTIKMPGPYSLDGAPLELPETFTVEPTAALMMIDLS